MSEYDNKYLKYKNKYINLKILNDEKYGGGCIPVKMYIFYDNKNELVNDVFNDIKTQYLNLDTSTNEKLIFTGNQIDNINNQLNLLLNIFRYDVGTNQIKPLFICEIKNLKNFKNLIKPFEKAKKEYIKHSTFEFLNNKDKNTDKYIITDDDSFDSKKQKCINIMNYINEDNIINNDKRKEALNTLLQIIKIYQDLSTVNILLYHKLRIGNYSYINDKINSPPGMTGNMKFFGVSNNTDFNTIIKDNYKDEKGEINSEIINKLDVYNKDKNENTNIIIGLDYNTDVKFNKINSIIDFKLYEIKSKKSLECTGEFDEIKDNITKSNDINNKPNNNKPNNNKPNNNTPNNSTKLSIKNK